MEEALAYSQQYKNALPSIDALNQLYGGAINRRTAEENNQQGLAMHGRAQVAAKGTGLETDDFIQAMRQMGNYGITSETQALNMAKSQALWSRFTGADLGTIQKYAGQTKRYGGEDNAISVAYGGLRAQDMGKGQFAEYLNSLERVMADGISKGFTRSTEEIAGNMAMLYRLSGGSPLWQGEQGAQRLSQMNEAVSNATNLETVEDVMSFSAAKAWFDKIDEDTPGDFELGDKVPIPGGGTITYTGTYIDPMQVMERGFSPETAKGSWDMIKKATGGDPGATIEHLMKMYKMNYSGGVALWDMFRNADSMEGGWDAPDLKKNVEGITKDINYQSDSETLQNLLSEAREISIKIEQIEFGNTEIKLLREQAEILAKELQKRQSEYGRTPVEAAIITSTEMRGHSEEFKIFRDYQNLPTRYDEWNGIERVDYGELFSKGLVDFTEKNPGLSSDPDFLSNLAIWSTNFRTSTTGDPRGPELDLTEFSELASAIRAWVSTYNEEKETNITIDFYEPDIQARLH